VLADYSHLTALRAPRPTLLTYNAADDCCFKSGHTLGPLVAAAGPIYSLFGAADKLQTHVNHNPGTHNFERENRERLYAMIGEVFYAGQADYPQGEIASESEIKTAEELFVPLPADNVDFQRLAQSLAADLPRNAELPIDRPAAERWQAERRRRLRALLRVPDYRAKAAEAHATAAGDCRVAARLVTLADWTLPLVEIAPPAVGPETNAVVLVGDAGRAALADEAARRVAIGERVVLVDLLLWGESKIKSQDPDYTYPLFLAAVGERPLGIQAAQLAAVAHLVRGEASGRPVRVAAHGRRACAAALVAAALEPEAIAALELVDSLTSFKQLLEENQPVEALPELFAFGLLAEFDVRELTALVAPRPVKWRAPTDRTRRELAPLGAFYGLFDAKFELEP
jgi:hypothetical protein